MDDHGNTVNGPLISVIIPCYNYGHLISETILSVVNQSYTNWEMIIVDDGSSDHTAEVVNQFTQKDKRIFFYQQENAGPSAARNRALKMANGDYIQYLDADDLIEKRKFELQLGQFAENSQADIVYGSVRYFTKDPFDEKNRMYTYWGKNREWMPGLKGYGKDIIVPALRGSFAHISTFLFKKSIISKAGDWDEYKRAAEDYLFVLNCVFANAYFLYADMAQTFALVRWHEKNASQDFDWIRKSEIAMRIGLRPRLQAMDNTEITETNENSIKALTLMINKSWRSRFLSGGPFDFVKKGLRFLRLDKLVQKLFYK